MTAVVIGIGNPDCGDDAAGRLVGRLLRGRLPHSIRIEETDGEATSLLARLEGKDWAYLIDACASGAAPGTLHRFDASSRAATRGAVRLLDPRHGAPGRHRACARPWHAAAPLHCLCRRGDCVRGRSAPVARRRPIAAVARGAALPRQTNRHGPRHPNMHEASLMADLMRFRLRGRATPPGRPSASAWWFGGVSFALRGDQAYRLVQA